MFKKNNENFIVLKPLVSIIAPIYNEDSAIEEFLTRIYTTTKLLADKYNFECILVDDGSKDDSLVLSKKLLQFYDDLKIIELRRNYGQTAALQAGLDYAKGEIIITLDADLQHFPEEIPNFLQKISEGYDVVCGWRYNRQEDILRRWPSKAANFLLRKITKLKINDIGTTYRAYRGDIIKDVKLLGESHRFVPVFANIAGAKICEVKIENIERPHGISNYNISRTLNVFIDLFFLFFLVNYLDRPSRIFGKIALSLIAFAMVILGCLTYVYITTHIPVVREHSGWFALAIAFFIIAIQLLLMGVIAEILARIYFATQQQTMYKIRNIWGNSK